MHFRRSTPSVRLVCFILCGLFFLPFSSRLFPRVNASVSPRALQGGSSDSSYPDLDSIDDTLEADGPTTAPPVESTLATWSSSDTADSNLNKPNPATTVTITN